MLRLYAHAPTNYKYTEPLAHFGSMKYETKSACGIMADLLADLMSDHTVLYSHKFRETHVYMCASCSCVCMQLHACT